VGLDVASNTEATTRFAHDFSRIPLHAPAPITIQPKLAINTPGDIYEQEADHLAEQVMRMPEPKLQRACACGGGCSKCQTEQTSQEHARLQTKHVGSSDSSTITAPPIVHQVLASPGQPLDTATRAFMEPRFGHDFSRVRVHSGAAAEQSALDVNANAYTVGHNIVFGAGRFAPETHEGRRLLSHELTHVVQQTGHHSMIQRQQQPSVKLLTTAVAAAAVADVTTHYDEDSIRTLEDFSARTPDGVFDADDAEALAKLQQVLHLTPNGKANEAFLDALLKIVGPRAAARSAMIHLVIDHANLDVSGALAVVYDPGTTRASDIHALPGGVSTIQIGNAGFASYRVMVAEIRKQIAARPAASPVTPVPATVLRDATIQQLAITLNKNLLNDQRSIKLLQGALGSRVTGQWDVDLVRHVAAKQQALGLTPSGGILFDSTFAAIGTEMIANGSQDAVLQLIVDYYDLDRSHAFNIVFDPNPPMITADAETLRAGPGFGTPGVVHVYPLGFAQPFAGLVHTVAHELGHIQQVIQGVASLNVREFLSEGIEIESKNMPLESIESDADIDLMNRSMPPVHVGFIQDAGRMLHFWKLMSPAEKQAQHQRYKDLRSIIVTRIANEGSASQKTKLAPFITILNAADVGIP
jgi:hypothetical protein